MMVAMLGAGLIWATQRYVRSLDMMAATSPDAAILRAGFALKVLVGIMAILAVGTSIYIVRSCRQVLAHRQLPPPGARVLGNPKVIVGTYAVVWGWTGYALAVVLVGAAGTVTALMWEFVDLMVSGIGPI